jgi:hypothetical protein
VAAMFWQSCSPFRAVLSLAALFLLSHSGSPNLLVLIWTSYSGSPSFAIEFRVGSLTGIPLAEVLSEASRVTGRVRER